MLEDKINHNNLTKVVITLRNDGLCKEKKGTQVTVRIYNSKPIITLRHSVQTTKKNLSLMKYLPVTAHVPPAERLYWQWLQIQQIMCGYEINIKSIT